MSRNSLLLLGLLLAGCDPLSSTGRASRNGDVKARIIDNVMGNESAAPKGVGAPMAWRIEEGQAFYAAAGQDPVFAIRCDRARNAVVLDRGGTGDFGLQVGGDPVALDSHAAANGRVQALVPLDNPALDRMAAPQAALTLATGAEPIAVPGGIAIRRIVETCRTPPPPPTPVVAPPVLVPSGNSAAPAPAPSPSAAPTGP